MSNYFLLALSAREHLDLCLQYALGGSTNSVNGFWAYLEIDEGDFVSFLYGAKAWNLYRVTSKIALRDSDKLPPWPPVTFKPSGQTYYFPFRFCLEPVRAFQESLVRPEFAYVAENLLLRGGYRKTHFQADRTTLQYVSQMGEPYSSKVDSLKVKASAYHPLVSLIKGSANPPLIYQFREVILQAIVKKYLREMPNLETILSIIGLEHVKPEEMEVLGELALPEGVVDILVKDATPIGTSSKVPIEVKLRSAFRSDIDQLENYVRTIGDECKGGVLIAEKASRSTISYAKERGLHIFLYTFDGESDNCTLSFSELLSQFTIHPV